MPVGFTGQCGMKSACSGQGVAVVGACKEKGGSFPFPPSLPLHPSLVCSRCSTCLSVLSLIAGQAFISVTLFPNKTDFP